MSNLINSLGIFLEKLFSAEPTEVSLPLEMRTVSLTGDTECTYFLSYKKHRDLLIALKYGDESKTSSVTGPLFESLSALREEHTRTTAPLVIIPLPQSRLRVLRRGFNQTKRLLQDTLRSDKEKLFTLETNNLIKIRETKKQALLPKSERLIAQKNAFFVRKPERLKGKTVILFDDIVTTGASLAEAKKTLLKAGVKRVVCIALAH